MKIGGKHYTSIWWDGESETIKIIDQRFLPWRLIIEELTNWEDVVVAIKDMHVRGAPAIGVVGAYGVCLALKYALNNNLPYEQFQRMVEAIREARPTAVNLAHCVSRVLKSIDMEISHESYSRALAVAHTIFNEEKERCRKIGLYGIKVLADIYQKKGDTVNILTHCNAGWIACVDFGTVSSVIYHARDMGIPVHVWVSETRPRNQGSRLTAWELHENGIPCTLIADNASGHIMYRGMVDVVIVGADRVSRNGDVANKIGTYLKAVAAKYNNIPFYVALPLSTFDFDLESGEQIPIEERHPDEVLTVEGWDGSTIKKVEVSDTRVPAYNPAFDITPASLVWGFITDVGVFPPSQINEIMPHAGRYHKV